MTGERAEGVPGEGGGTERSGDTSPPFRKVGIVGLGLMGGSFARALRRRWPSIWIAAESLEADEAAAARAEGVIDEANLRDPARSGSFDLLVLAAPLASSMGLLRETAALSSDAVVTDVASLMVPMLDEAGRCGILPRYVGGHPMAGGERSGWGASTVLLYEARIIWLSHGGAHVDARTGIERLWTELGASPSWIPAEEHDRRMVWTSHLPQLVSTALADLLEARGYGRSDLGPGGRDLTRLAGSSPGLWKDLLRHTPESERSALGEVASRLEEYAAAIESGELERLKATMERTRRWKESDE